MKFIDKLERKFGRFGIPNLTIYIIGCYVLGYILTAAAPGVLSMLSLDMSMVMKGQIWRLVTWVIYPPSSVGGMSNLLMFVLAIAFFYYPIGTSLERTWGTFRYTLYIFSGLLFTVIAAALLYAVTGGYVTDASLWKYFYHILHQSFYFSCLCSHISGSSAAAYVCDPHQDEMDGICIWTVYCVGYRIIS